MNKELNLSALGNLPRRETALVALVIVALLGLYYVYQQQVTAQEDLDGSNSSFLKTRSAALRLEDDQIVLEEQLAAADQEVESPDVVATFATSAQAHGLAKEFFDYTTSNSIGLEAFDRQVTTAFVGEEEYQAISYTLAAKGAPDDLIGIVSVLDGISTLVLQSLVLTRDVEGSDWTIDMGVVVVHE